MKKIGLLAVVVLVACGAVFWLLSRGQPSVPQTARVETAAAETAAAGDGRSPGDATVGEPEAASGEDGPAPDEAAADADGEAAEEEEPKTEEELREEAEEKLVNAFDDLTDKWMEPSEKGVTMKDVEAFRDRFRKVPKGRRDECVHRALNLVPDENVMLLAGILMDKTQDKEIVETVYNDILNRDEAVKKPILQQIFKDRSHPCWTDTAWILDVTDELPGRKKAE